MWCPYKCLSRHIINLISIESSILFLMPPQFHERVDKWTHKPWSSLNYKKHLLLAFTFSVSIKSENNKNIFTFCNYTQNPKTPLPFALVYFLASVYFLAFYFHLFILFCFTNTEALCLATTQWSWGEQDKELVLQIAGQGLKKPANCSREFDIKS
jgi:hypothetical protein